MSTYDVIVVGSGIAGMAACLNLARGGLRVLSIEAEASEEDPVGESLDWSSPDLLRALGLPMDRLIDEDIATYKRHVILRMPDGCEQHYVPGEWLAKRPWKVNLATIHVDRRRLNQALRNLVQEAGVVTRIARVASVESDGRHILALHTASGERLEARWYVDASGSAAALFPRHFRLPARDYGPHKVAIWDYFEVEESVEGTTLNADQPDCEYLEWVWQIPVHPHVVSVGYVARAETIRDDRRAGRSLEEIFATQLARFPELAAARDEKQRSGEPPTLRTTSFRCRVHNEAAGTNWLAVGESAAMVDPMTSNGVTAALRHAEEAASLILRAHRKNKTSLPRLGTWLYSRRIAALGHFFNSGIEKVIYDWPIRRRVGIARAGDVYTIPAWLMNLVYARMRPRGALKTALYTGITTLLRGSLSIFYWFSRRSRKSRRSASADAVCTIP
ncbi:NAD(P)/FAD-dependent oxidoreductase [Silvibacterium sp.]|uniref:NAD(P)/FAD-dependent oxidoreductase n=1 Tax=Silvibacterium sp. TaxID=1964179 RepID=UPI0039E5D8EE